MATIHNHLVPLKIWTVDDSNVMTKLKLKRLKTIPTTESIRQNLGPRLADAVFSSVCPVTKIRIGLGKELIGPGDELWSQPKRQLLGELIMEPYPSRRHRQALTHQAILNYGGKCMEEWENKVATQKELEMEEKVKEIVAEMNRTMESKINQVRANEREDFLIRIAMMEERLEAQHQVEMEALKRKLIEEKDAKVAEVMETMNRSHKEETEALLDASKKLLTNRFHFKINWIKADLEEDYNNKLKAETKLIEMKLRKKIDSSQCADLEAMKHQLFQNVVCTACLTADYLITEFQQKIDDLKKERADFQECNMHLVNEIEQLEKQNELRSNDVKAWECVIRHVVQQFQKFIEFQLKLPQGEATHLISWEKVVEKKNEILNGIISKEEKRTPSESKELKKKKEINLEEKSSLISAELCENKDIISIIYSIIRRVIPSASELTDSEQEITNILENIIKKVIPSTSSFVGTNESQVSKELTLNVEKKYCPKYQRTEEEMLAYQTKKSQDAADGASYTNSTHLNQRILEITNIMHQHPNVMKFIQGP